MLSSQKVKFSMYKAVASHFNNNPAIVSSLPALQSAQLLLNETIALIGLTMRRKEEVTTGVSITKLKTKNALIREACTLAGNIYAHADLTGNDELKEKVRYSLSDLKRLKDGELAVVCRIILDLAWQNLPALAPFNVNAASLESFGLKISAYEALEQNPRNTVSLQVACNQEMKQHFANGDNIMKSQVDRIMRGFMDTNSLFYNTYSSNRTILDAPTTRTQIKGTVINALDNTPIYGATIVITENKLSVTTGTDGKYLFKPLSSGTYTLTISKKGFKTQTIPVYDVKRGKISRADVKLQPE
jgi:hypothetical protein